MMQQLHTTTERVQRPVARAVAATCAARLTDMSVAGLFCSDTGMANATTFAWNAKPSVHAPAICTHGKYHTWRLQEMPT